MSDKLIRIDYEKRKAIFSRTIQQKDGSFTEKEIEVALPQQTVSEGVLRKVKRGADGKMYETEEIIKFPLEGGPIDE